MMRWVTRILAHLNSPLDRLHKLLSKEYVQELETAAKFNANVGAYTDLVVL
jgi:hypothetical protein